MSKTIVVIGAGPGLGNHVAREFGGHGYRAVLVARREEALAGYVAELASEGIEADYAVAECADFAGLSATLRGIEREQGPIEVVEYNAAVLMGGSPLELAPEELDRRYRVDVCGALAAAQAVAPSMVGRGHGSVLFTGGGLALDPAPAFLSVSVHKAALRALALALNKELAGTGVYAGVVNIRGNIGGEDPAYAPDRLARLFWELHERRDAAEITY